MYSAEGQQLSCALPGLPVKLSDIKNDQNFSNSLKKNWQNPF